MDAVLIGRKLTALRGERKREEVAFSCGISLSALAMYETGKRIPRDEVKMALAQFYATSIEYLFFNSEYTKREHDGQQTA